MIIDDIANLHKYENLLNLRPFLKHLENKDLSKIEVGKHVVNEEGAFFYCFEYTTRDASLCKAEVHERFIDVHVIISGAEGIGWEDRSHCEVEPYDRLNDVSMVQGVFEPYQLTSGKFAVFFTHEAHVTALEDTGGPCHVKKLVLKVDSSS